MHWSGLRTLSGITHATGRDQVVQRMCPATGQGDNMIHGQALGLRAAVGAAMAIGRLKPVPLLAGDALRRCLALQRPASGVFKLKSLGVLSSIQPLSLQDLLLLPFVVMLTLRVMFLLVAFVPCSCICKKLFFIGFVPLHLLLTYSLFIELFPLLNVLINLFLVSLSPLLVLMQLPFFVLLIPLLMICLGIFFSVLFHLWLLGIPFHASANARFAVGPAAISTT
jgi:hypothetical protein